jgi:Carboxypeptidase regulatory-like domain
VRRGTLRGIFFVAMTGLWAGHADAQPPAKTAAATTHYEIKGVVLNSVTKDPVPHCHLMPTLNGRGGFEGRPGMANRANFGNRQFPAQASEFDCDTSGHFTVSLPSAGAWRMVASARGFVSAAYDEHAPFSSAIVLTAEAPTAEIEFHLSPEASIVGLVLDEAGEPVRNAQITLQNVPPPTPGGPQPAGGTRGGARTDDRGMYEMANLAPGDYRLSVHVQPWYAANAQPIRVNDPNTASLDPSLDFAYPVTWFPGVGEAGLAETITLHAGDTRQADFHLIPIPSIHMRILVPPRANNGPNTAAGVPGFPLVQQMIPGGGQSFVPVTTHYDQQSGQIDVGGLTPGVYQVRLAGPNQEGHAAVVEVSGNSTRMLDLNSPPHDMARIKLHFDGLADLDSDSRPDRGGGVQVTLIGTDAQRGNVFSSNAEGGAGMALARREPRDPNADRTVEVPPGRYEVVLQGRPNFFITGLTAKGAEASGRYVTVGAGDSTLTVHVASGRASLNGIATLEGKPCMGAMILLVPITIEDPNSITMLRQDQTNTDGSFEMASILPGQYILVAIDHGWQINWGDSMTLRRYLMQGVPVDLKSSAIVKQNIAAQAP